MKTDMLQVLKNRFFSKEKCIQDKTIWRVALPCVLENLLTFAAGLVIAAMIGRLSGDEISAQSIGNRITGVLQSLFKGIGVGATVIIGVSYGRGNLGRCRKIAEEMMLLVLPISLVLVGVFLYEPRPFLRLFADDISLIELAVPYTRVAIWLVPSVAVSRIITAAFNGQGNTHTPMVIAVTMNIINAILGYITIFVCRWGLMGAAWSLTCSYFIGMVLGLVALYHKRGLYGNTQREGLLFRESWRDIHSSFSTGLPASCENMMWSVAAIIMSRALLTYGTNAFAGYQLASQVEEFLAAPCFGFQIAVTTLVAQSIGRNDPAEAYQYHRRISFWGILVSLPVTVILLTCAPLCMRMLTDKPPIQDVGALYLMLASIAYIPQTLNMVDFGAIRVASSKSFPLIGTILGMWGVRVPVAALAAWVWNTDIIVIFAGIVFDQVFRWGLALLYRARKKIFWGNPSARMEVPPKRII